MVADQNKVRTRINLEDDWEVFANANIGRLNAKHNSKFTKALNTAPIANSTTSKGNTVKCLEVKLSKVWQCQTLMMDVCALKSETSLTKYIATHFSYSLFFVLVEWGCNWISHFNICRRFYMQIAWRTVAFEKERAWEKMNRLLGGTRHSF